VPNLKIKLPNTGPMASTKREPITEVWGRSPSGFKGRAPCQGIRGLLKLINV